MKLQPLDDRVVAVREVKKQTASGFLLTEESAERSIELKVTEVGPNVTAVKVGDAIVVDDAQRSFMSSKEDDSELFIIREKNILAIVK